MHTGIAWRLGNKVLGIPYSIIPVPVATPRHAWCADSFGVPRAALNEHVKDCDFQPNTNCDACYLWRQMDGHTTKGQVCFETGTDKNHLKVRRHMVDSGTVPQGPCRAGGHTATRHIPTCMPMQALLLPCVCALY